MRLYLAGLEAFTGKKNNNYRIDLNNDTKVLTSFNNVSTMLCNCGENFMFIGMAYIGIYSMTDIISIATSICIIEAIIALIDTPFLYISKKISR